MGYHLSIGRYTKGDTFLSVGPRGGAPCIKLCRVPYPAPGDTENGSFCCLLNLFTVANFHSHSDVKL